MKKIIKSRRTGTSGFNNYCRIEKVKELGNQRQAESRTRQKKNQDREDERTQKQLLETDEDLNKTEKELWDEKNENKITRKRGLETGRV